MRSAATSLRWTPGAGLEVPSQAPVGPVRLTDVDGREIPDPDPMNLCRCGQSGNKPFCDGTHLTVDYDGTLAN
jgi:Iron-binding zinc finger CDGSH type